MAEEVAAVARELRASFAVGWTRPAAQLRALVRMIEEKEGDIGDALYADLAKPHMESYLDISMRSRKEHKRKKLEKRKRVEEDSRPREAVKTNKRRGSPSATLLSLRIRSPVVTLVRAVALERGMRSPSPATPCCTVHFPSLTRSPSPARTSPAHEVLVVPASTVATKSAFSTGRRVISDYRSRLSSDTVEALICLQDWFKAAKHDRGSG